MKYLVMIILVFPFATEAQVVKEQSLVINLNESVSVLLYQGRDCVHCYYYLPKQFTVAGNADSQTPEVSLVTWADEDSNKVVGGILHFLIEWKLTSEEETVLRQTVRAKFDSTAVIAGPALVRVHKPAKIAGGSSLAQVFRDGLSGYPLTASSPGSKMAFSFRFDEAGIGNIIDCQRHPQDTRDAIEAVYAIEVATPGGGTKADFVSVRIPIAEIIRELK